jgi:hypothetical protein
MIDASRATITSKYSSNPTYCWGCSDHEAMVVGLMICVQDWSDGQRDLIKKTGVID